MRCIRTNTPVKIVIMVVGLFVTLDISQAILNAISNAVPVAAGATFNATSTLGTSWTNITNLITVVPIALVGWYLLRLISGGED